ncbi:Cysteine desulfurase [Candidatus Protochlamydia amoebophila]|uniref:cysteine desulfurase family protein n=1 Tax=Candidatus Protochlamydia amoebophila TaxID=362787 RepID=UPI001BC94F29|nr:cysteine desulfurase family protein [Candidatus Protochlamydia amoebophila]MBS4164022.1 Cysteine desulfurase [Candidatus Protochlamydia amoebophila]
MNRRVYLDCNSSTAIDPRVLKVLIQELQEEEGNPSSVHYHGQFCRKKLERSRQIIARFLKVKPQEIIFTSGGTEGANLLIKGVLQRFSLGQIISSNVEHACVDEVLKEMEKQGHSVTFLETGSWGAVDPQKLKEAIGSQTRLITLMAANNETGVKTDIEACAAIAQEAQIPFIVDGVALLGKEMFNIPKGVSAMFFSGHKVHVPKGIGFCFVRQGLKLVPQIIGGGQEQNRRSGTENLAGIVALAEGISILSESQEEITNQLRSRRDHLEKGLIDQLDQVIINGDAPRIANTSNLSFVGVDGETLLMQLDMQGISVSHGSACSSGALEPSRVLLNMGFSNKRAGSAIRFSVGRMTTEEDIKQTIQVLVKTITKIKSKSFT